MPEVASLPGQTCTCAMTAQISLEHDLKADWRSAEQLSRARAGMQSLIHGGTRSSMQRQAHAAVLAAAALLTG